MNAIPLTSLLGDGHLLLGQQPDPLGISGWVTAAASVGLLGPVLYWLCYKHLPSKDIQMRDFMEAKDRQLTAAMVANESSQNRLLETFTAVVREERQVCQRWHEENAAVLAQILQETKENRHTIKDMMHQLNLSRAVQEAKTPPRPAT